MTGPRQMTRGALFCAFPIAEHVPPDHLLRSIDRRVDPGGMRRHPVPFDSATGRPSVAPELMIRLPIVGCASGIRSERRLCQEVHPDLAHRWFCRRGLTAPVPDPSTFSKNRHGRFRGSARFRHLLEAVPARCIAEGLVRGGSLAADTALIGADSRPARVDFAGWSAADVASRATRQAGAGAVRGMPGRPRSRCNLHPGMLTADTACGTCRMGHDNMAVVDDRFRLHGLEGLRVVDASVMPRVISANLNAPTQMTAARAADYIAGKPQVDPIRARFAFLEEE